MSNTSNPTQVQYLRLQGRHRAPKDFYDEVRRQGRQRVPNLRHGKEYKAEDLVDPELWGDDKGLHQLIGRCIAHQVATGLLLLRFAGCPRCTNKRYLRT